MRAVAVDFLLRVRPLSIGKPSSLGGRMRPVKRYGVNKHRSARQFRRNTARTKAPNVSGAPMRGGIRL